MAHQKTLFITGASGMLGVPTVRHFLAKGYAVRALVRHPENYPFFHPALTLIKGDLFDTSALIQGCRGAQGIIHLAGRKNDESDSARVNIKGSAQLGVIAHREKITHFLYVSTASVYLSRKGHYASTKLQGEQAVQKVFPKVAIIRPSVIYSSLQEGIIGSLTRSLHTPLPLAFSLRSAHFYPIHIADFIGVLEAILTRSPEYRIFDVGGYEALRISDMHQLVRRSLRLHKPTIFFDPSFLLPFATFASWCHFPLPITPSNLLGAKQEISFNPQASMRLLHITPRPFAQGIQALLTDSAYGHQEADLFLRYVSPSVIHSTLSIREYRLFETACQTAGLRPIPSSHLPPPFLLKGLDLLSRLRAPRGALQRKLIIACAILEMSPAPYRVLMRPSHPLAQIPIYLSAGISLCFALLLACGLIISGRLKHYGL